MNGTARISRIGGGVAALLSNSATLWAADAAREDGTSIFVWIFLAFCALIVVAQLIPAALMMFGAAKGIRQGPAHSPSEPADHAPSPDA